MIAHAVAMLYSSFGQLTIYITNRDSQETNRCQIYQRTKKKQFITQIKYGIATQGQFKGEGGATRRWLLAVQKKSHVRMNRPAFRSKIRNQVYAYQRRQLRNFRVSKQLYLKTELIKSLIKSHALDQINLRVHFLSSIA